MIRRIYIKRGGGEGGEGLLQATKRIFTRVTIERKRMD
jgi:hypothetical protein